ncbi:WD-40 repeat protein [Reticulomyxa filosa]|uniref:WD-40 repeat protein n=1 Tax=Reticulomyxa filosa TaxID=46433 RepID=X6M7R7_RETFI|nr:WD-40 repeat protein [Reticulomyxa filosa]|eukprot:ETO09075.1 WD-40 repeat protein [Reticulomyxa filosa]
MEGQTETKDDQVDNCISFGFLTIAIFPVIFAYDLVSYICKKKKSNRQSRNRKERRSRQKSDKLQKEEEKAEVGETKPGINLQGYCVNEDCLAAKAKLPVWVHIGFGSVSFTSDKTSYRCPDCGQSTVTSIKKVLFFNSEHSICANDGTVPVKENHYQCFYAIKAGLTYTLKAEKIRQHATSLEDLIGRSENAMVSNEIINLVAELQKYLITVVKPPKVKDKVRLLEKIQCDYKGDYNQVFDVGRFTILCDNATKLQTAVAVMKKAEKFNLIVSEDKDFFDRQSKTHHRFHNIKLFVPKHDVFVEMQATLKNFTTLEGYTVIENPKLSHLFYEHIRAWGPKNQGEEDLKQASDETLTKINDIICEWVDDKAIQKIANRYKSHLDIGILKPSQLFKKTELEINNSVSLNIAQFVYKQLCTFVPEKVKGKAIHVVLYEYYKKYIIGDKNPASCVDFALLLQESRKQEMEEDIAIAQALETYIPLQANNYPHVDGDDDEDQETYDCHQHVIEFLEEKEEEKKQSEQPSLQQRKLMIIQGKSGSGKSIFCRHLEESLWNNYVSDPKKNPIPVYISFAKSYNKKNEKDIILQALQGKHISKDIMDAIREKISFVFIMDGFDEIFDFYRKSDSHEQYFYDRFNLNQWNAKVIVTCRSKVLRDDDIKQVLIGANQTQNITEMMYLWPFTKLQMHSYIEKFAKMKSKYKKKNDENDWTPKKYEETLKNYSNLQKMVEEPFLLQLILTVLPSLVQQYGADANISKAQVYEVFNDHWIDIHIQNITSKLSELRIQSSINKIKSTFKQYCLDLGFEMFFQGTQVAVEPEFQPENNNEIWSKLDPITEEDETKKIKTTNEKAESSIAKTQDVWEKYFNGDSIAKYVLRRIGENKYQFLHKSCQEYYAAQKTIFEIISWKPSVVGVNNQQFQQQFEMHIQKLSINYKLLNEELGIIQFIAERVHDNSPIFVNLKSRLFRIIEASKNNGYVSIAAANAITILNSANVNMHYRNWNNIKIPHAILDRAFLEGTNFSNANLDNVRFYQSCLNNTNFTNASMNDGTKILSCSRDNSIRIWDTSSEAQIHLLKGHSDNVNIAQFSHDDSKVVSCSEDKTVRLWDALSGKQIQIWEEHSEPVAAVQFSPDNSKVVSCSEDKTIRIWDVSSGKQIHLLKEHTAAVNAVEFSPDGSKIVSCSDDKTIRIWDVSSGKQIQILEGHLEEVKGVRFISNGSKIISYSDDTTLRIWDLSLGQQSQILEGHSNAIQGIQISSDGLSIVSYSTDATLRIWDLLSGEQLQVLEGHSTVVRTAQFSTDGSRVVSGSSDRTIRIWDVSSGKQVQKLEGHSDGVYGVEFFPNDPKILSCSWDGTIRIWDSVLERKIHLSEGHSASVTGVQFSPDGSKVVSCALDEKLRLWDVRSGRQSKVLEGHTDGVNGAKFSFDGSKIVSFAIDFTIRIWDVSSGKQLQVLEGHSDTVNDIQFSPDCHKLVSCSSDNTIRIWDISSGEQLHLLDGHSCPVLRIQFSADASKLVSCSDDNTLRLWDVLSGKQLRIFKGHSIHVSAAQFSPDQSKIVSCSQDRTIRLWDVLSGKQLLLLKGHSGYISEVQFSPDGSKILSGSQDKTIRLWDSSSGQQIRLLSGHSDMIKRVQFTPDGSKIISYSTDKTIRLWDVSSGRQILTLEGHEGDINGIHLSPDGSKLVSCSEDSAIRLWGSENCKIIDVNATSLVKCIWQVRAQSLGLAMKSSIWKNVNVKRKKKLKHKTAFHKDIRLVKFFVFEKIIPKFSGIFFENTLRKTVTFSQTFSKISKRFKFLTIKKY